MLLALLGICALFPRGRGILFVGKRLDGFLRKVTLTRGFFALGAGLARLGAPLLLRLVLEGLLRLLEGHQSLYPPPAFL